MGIESSSGGLFGRRLEFRSGKSKAARKATQEQERQVAHQQQKEDIRLAEAEGEVGKRKFLAKSKTAGRSLLTATSPTGAQGLGG